MINLKYAEQIEKAIIFITALNSFLVYIKILEILKPKYIILIKFYMNYETFGEYAVISPIIMVLSAILIVYMIYHRRLIEINIAIIPSILIYYFFKIEIHIVLTIILIPILLYTSKYYREYIKNLLIVLILFQLFTLIHYIFLYFGVITPFEIIAYYEYRIYSVSKFLTPYLGFFFMASWLILLLPLASSRIKSVLTRLEFKENVHSELFDFKYLDYRVVLSIAVMTALFASLYPWSPNINSMQLPFATDVPGYVELAETVENIFTHNSGKDSQFYF